MATRSQSKTQVTWSGSNTKSIATGSTVSWADDNTLSSDNIGTRVTVEGTSSGSASDDILEVHAARKDDPDYSSSGTPDTYDSPDYTYIGSIDCSSGNTEQRTFDLPHLMAGDEIRFGALTNGTNSITVGMIYKEDTISL